MPKSSIATSKKRPVAVKRSPSADILSDSMEDEKPSIITKRQKKDDLMKSNKIDKEKKIDNPCTSLATYSEFGNEITKIFQSLGSTMQNSFRAKKKRLQEYTTDALKINQSKISKLSQHQLENRKQLLQKLHHNVKTIFEEWECDLNHSKDEEKKLLKTIHQYFRTMKEQHSCKIEKLNALRREHEEFFEAMYDQENKHAEEYRSISKEFEKDLMELQNKMMIKTQQDDMFTVENSLKSVLFV